METLVLNFSQRKHSVKEIAALVILCDAQNKLDSVIMETEDLHIVDLILSVKLFYTLDISPQLVGRILEKTFANITTDNCDEACNILSSLLLIKTDGILKLLSEHLQKQSDVKIVLKLLQIAGKIDEIIDEDFLVCLYQKISNEEECISLKKCFITEILMKYRAPSTKIMRAALENEDLFMFSCLNEMFLCSTVFSSNELLNFLQHNLFSGNNKKLVLYVLKSCIKKTLYLRKDLEGQSNLVCNGIEDAGELKKMWNDFFNLIEALEEGQLHLVIPSLGLLPGIVKIHKMWLVCVYKSMLTHIQATVVFHGLKHVLNYHADDEQLFSQIISYVLLALNRADDSDDYNKCLIALSEFLCQCKLTNILIEESLKVSWTLPAAWYVHQILLEHHFSEISLSLMGKLINMFKRLPHKFIRRGCISLVVNCIHNALKSGIDLSFENFLEIAVHFSDIDDMVFARYTHLEGWKEDNIILDNVTKWQDDAQKIQAVLKLVEDDVEMSQKLISLVRNKEIPSKTCAYILLLLKECYVHNQDVNDYLIWCIDDLKVDDDFGVLIELITAHTCDRKLLQKCKFIISNMEEFPIQQICLGLAVCLKAELKVFEILLALFESNSKIDAIFFNFFIAKYCTLILPENKPATWQIFTNILDTQTDEIVAIVYKHLQDILCCFETEEVAAHFLVCCYKKLTSSSERNAEFFSANFESCLSCTERFSKWKMDRIGQLLEFHESAYYVLVNFLENKAEHVADFSQLLVKLMLHGGVFNKTRKIEYEVCKRIQDYTDSGTLAPIFEEIATRTKALSVVIHIFKDGAEDSITQRADYLTELLLDGYRAVFNSRYFADSQIHLVKLRVIQALLVIHNYVTEQKDKLIEFVMECLCKEESQQPSVTQLLQFLLILLIRYEFNYVDGIVGKINNADYTRTSTVAAFIPVLIHLSKGASEAETEKLYSVFLSLAMGPQFKLRLYSQMAIQMLSKQTPYQSILKKYETSITASKNILRQHRKDMDNLLQSDIYFLGVFNPEAHYTLETIYVDIPRLNGVTPTEWELFKLNVSFPSNAKVFNNDRELSNYKYEQKRLVKQPELATDEVCANLQKKITPKSKFDDDKEILGDLILVCSLVDSAANLGGLSRTCEVYGVKQMVVSDAKIMASKDFKSLSLSSENWVDIIEVKIDELKDYLRSAKSEGYVVIGVEQTSDSVKLNSYKFPKKSLLVLGNEKEGISPSLLPFLDVCVEIPQFGYVRSLNVHVAGAIIIWEYVKQHVVES